MVNSAEDDTVEEELEVSDHVTVLLSSEEHEVTQPVLDLLRYSKL